MGKVFGSAFASSFGGVDVLPVVGGPVLRIDVIAGDDYITAAEHTTVTISGTSSGIAGALTLAATDGINNWASTATVSGGAWTADDTLDMTGWTDGPITVTVELDSNPAITAARTAELDAAVNYFVDATLSSESTTYRADTRSPTGGINRGYLTLNAAFSAAPSGTTIYCREGEIENLTARLLINKQVHVVPWQSESPYLTVTAGTFYAIYLTAAGSTFRIPLRGGGDGTASSRAIFLQADNCTVDVDVQDYNGMPFYISGAYGGTTGSLFRIVDCTMGASLNGSSASANVWDNAYLSFDPSIVLPGACLSNSNGTNILNNFWLEGGGTNTPGEGAVKCSGGALTIGLVGAVGNGANGATSTTFVQTGGTFTVNNGVLCGNINDPLNKVYSGTITFNSTAFNDVVASTQPVERTKRVSFYGFDSNHTRTGAGSNVISLDLWRSAFAANSAAFSYYPDDCSGLSADEIIRINNFIAAGGELCAENASSTSLILDNPLRVSYSGSATNVAIVVDTDSSPCTLTVYKNYGSTNDVITTVNLDTGSPDIGHETTTGTAYLWYVLDNLDIDGTTLSLENNSTDGGFINQWDDVLSCALATGVYNISGTATNIPMDKTKWYDDDILGSMSALISSTNATEIKSFLNYKLTDAGAAAETYMQGVGITSLLSGNDGAYTKYSQTGAGFDAFSLSSQRDASKIRGDTVQSGIGLTNYIKGAAANENNIRAFAACTISAANALGLYPLIELSRKLESYAVGTPGEYILSDDDVVWLLDEFTTNGYTVTTVSDAVAALSA